jgi:hypothetical protein
VSTESEPRRSHANRAKGLLVSEMRMRELEPLRGSEGLGRCGESWREAHLRPLSSTRSRPERPGLRRLIRPRHCVGAVLAAAPTVLGPMGSKGAAENETDAQQARVLACRPLCTAGRRHPADPEDRRSDQNEFAADQDDHLARSLRNDSRPRRSFGQVSTPSIGV